MRRTALLTLLTLVVLFAVSSSAAARGLTTGFFDIWPMDGGARMDEARASGASFVRVEVTWSAVAPARPADPTNPADAAYRWGDTDRIVAAARARDLQVMVSFSHAPTWAEGANRPAGATEGSWAPDPAAVGDFAGALARRYAGQARYLQLWNEPNLPAYLAPQRTAPRRFRAMLNAAYPAVRAAGLRLVTAGNAPYGGNGRTRPVRFWRRVFAKRVFFDVFAHQPYSVGAPQRKSSNAGDVSIAEVTKLVRQVRRAVRRGRALPRRRKPTWVTELSYDSSPPDPNGVPARTHARWLADAFALLWRQGVDHVFWTRVRDEPEGAGYGSTYQSGVFLLDGTPKLAQRAYAFPLSCLGGRLWTRAPRAGTVHIVRRGRTLLRLRTGRDRIATARVRRSAGLRAVQAGRRSLACR